MNVEEQITAYISSQRGPKQSDMQALHHAILQLMPNCPIIKPIVKRFGVKKGRNI